MVKKSMKRSLVDDDRYKPKIDKPDMYEALWGTRNTKASRVCKSITIAKHPVMTWAIDVKAVIATKGHTDSERRACLEMISDIDNLGDFTGVKTFDLDVPSDGMFFQAVIIRLPA